MNDEISFQISPHALARFRERWEFLKGEKLEESDVVPVLQSLIMEAKPELENEALLKRKKIHGESSYTVSGYWRFVWQDNVLVTIELQHRGTFVKPKLYHGYIDQKFCMKVTEEKEFTLVEKYILNNIAAERLALYNKPEVNAIIRLLRLCGLEVHYTRIGTELLKQDLMQIDLPKELRTYVLQEAGTRETMVNFPNMNHPFKIIGITLKDCQDILNFITNEEWFGRVKLIREEIDKQRQQKAEEKRRRRELQEEQRRLKLERKLKAAEMKKIQDLQGQESRRRNSIGFLLQILNSSENFETIFRLLKTNFPKRIQIDEHKLGKNWLINYRFAWGKISATVILRDASTLEEAKKEAKEKIIIQLKELVKCVPTAK